MMNSVLFEQVAQILTKDFQVDPALVRPEATLADLGLDSLSLMEFVFAVEDQFAIRIPEGKLDPRQAGLNLQHLIEALEAALPSAARV